MLNYSQMSEQSEVQLSGAELLEQRGLNHLVGSEVMSGVTLERAIELCRHVLPLVESLNTGLQHIDNGTDLILDAVGKAIPEDVRDNIALDQAKKKLMSPF